MEFFNSILFTTLISVVGYLLHRHFQDFDNFKDQVHNRFSQLSNEIEQFKKETMTGLSLVNTRAVDLESRKKLEDLRQVFSSLKKQVDDDRMTMDELVSLIKNYREIVARKKNG